MNRILRVLETLVFLGVLAACLGPANAAQLQVNGGAPYLCAAVQGSNIANKTPVIAYPCSRGRFFGPAHPPAPPSQWGRPVLVRGGPRLEYCQQDAGDRLPLLRGAITGV